MKSMIFAIALIAGVVISFTPMIAEIPARIEIPKVYLNKNKYW